MTKKEKEEGLNLCNMLNDYINYYEGKGCLPSSLLGFFKKIRDYLKRTTAERKERR